MHAQLGVETPNLARFKERRYSDGARASGVGGRTKGACGSGSGAMQGFDLNGKIGVVTGRCCGISRVITETLVAEGAAVIVFDLAPETAPAGVAIALKVDVSHQPTVTAAFGEIDKQFKSIDFLVNNAGIDIKTVP